MKVRRPIRNETPSLLDVVALLTDVPAQSLARGQVGTAVEQLDDKTWLVEFGDDDSRAYAVAQQSQSGQPAGLALCSRGSLTRQGLGNIRGQN